MIHFGTLKPLQCHNVPLIKNLLDIINRYLNDKKQVILITETNIALITAISFNSEK